MAYLSIESQQWLFPVNFSHFVRKNEAKKKTFSEGILEQIHFHWNFLTQTQRRDNFTRNRAAAGVQ